MAAMSKHLKDPDLPKHSEPQPGASALLRADAQGDVTLSFSDGSEPLKMNRRDFLRVSSVAAATAAMSSAACRRPVREIVPYVDRPEEVRIGMSNHYASVCTACPSQCGMLVKSRAGRPIKLEGNPQHPVSQGALCARGQASYIDLYDPDRLRDAQRVSGESVSAVSWEDIDSQVAAKLSEIRGGGGLRILTGAVHGPATDALIAEVTSSVPNARHYTYEALGDDAMLAANEASFGSAHVPHYRFDKASLIVSFGSDFLGTWLSPSEFTRQFASRRNPDADMSQLIAFESTLTLTGINADQRVRVRPDAMVDVAMAVAHQLFTAHSPKGVPAGAVRQALSAFTPAAVVERLGGDLNVAIIESVAQKLSQTAGKSIVVAGGNASATSNGVALESAVNLINAALGNDGQTIERDRPSYGAAGLAQLKALIAEIESGDVDMLIISGTNPVYSAPASLNVAEALAKVPLVISTSTHFDETARQAHYVATGCHSLEAWGDSNPRVGVHAIRQPAILPLYNTRSFEDSLMTWFGTAELSRTLAAFIPAPPQPAGNHPGAGQTYDTGPFYRFLRDYWQREVYPKADSLASFDQFWLATMREGVYLSNDAQTTPSLRVSQTVANLPSALTEIAAADDLGSKVLQLFASIPLYDGRQANNGHLQELPDPISKHVWGSYAMVSYKTLKGAKLKNGQYITVQVEGGPELSFQVIMVPGMHDDVIGIPLGYGRTAAGDVANGVGANAFKLSLSGENGVLYSGIKATIKKTDNVEVLSTVQQGNVIDVDYHRIMATAELKEYREKPDAGIHHPVATKNLWEDHDFGNLKWGMSIDMSKCTGCSACVIACQEENNIPVVGRQGVLEGREMHWLRIDRYYQLPEEAVKIRSSVIDDPMYSSEPEVAFGEYLANPRVLMHPMLCQHCDRAPCETVCPVLATMQSSDGLNQMSYQRCVGTRYCSNNCPYKVRRYNWFNYSENRGDTFFARLYPELKEHGRLNQTEPLQLGLNPDVTVRTRGVMEKCTFCVQRIRRGKWEIMKEGRRSFREGEVVTACQQACPAGAIDFGNVLDDTQTVSKMHKSPRATFALSDINTRPAIAYMTSIWNTDDELV
ncbi:4Fe-4S dicluster domain-containing protein [Lujinxingia sediminis]|uniref:4Fe-4S dicluster domain-containing protein n=2 Tax=Lujinxingia sediminis TaxID=2480984 RepID=A0ABY0CSK0_9DELT|nr:4Fe-4S dicluster domain-containing protein [Lujinxingia sediminis]